MPDRPDLWAHSPPKGKTLAHPLFGHLRDTARRAASFGQPFGAGDLGSVSGWLHDLGKLRDPFQRRVRGEAVRAPHAIYGAYLLHESFGQSEASWALAMIIAGHHAGLPDADRSPGSATAGKRPSRTLMEWLAEEPDDFEAVRAALSIDEAAMVLPPLPRHLTPATGGRMTKAAHEKRYRSLEFFIRMLFSTLVDADWLDTSAFYDGERRFDYEDIPQLRRRLDGRIDGMVSALEPSVRASPVNRLRAEVLGTCRSRAEGKPGFFSLTVPTGGGKTLAGMAFALRHAERHGLRRVIAAIPYTSILEQNAQVYRTFLGSLNVVEHHSSLDMEARLNEAKKKRREGGEVSESFTEEVATAHELSIENWDAPVIVTTNVQLFETLFSNRPAPCRKLHRIAGSVIVLDEAQVLPRDLLVPIIDGLRELVSHYGCTVMFTTATRPAFDRRASFPQGLEEVREIVADPADLANRLRRVEVEWRCDDVTEWEHLADEMADFESVLAVVHSRADARELAGLLVERCGEDSVFHLSAGMCPAHRSAVIERIQRRLAPGGPEEGKPCRVVSTQLIEAGVDVDFPTVYRALAGVDSLVQAAGRCNRNGQLRRDGELIKGRFVIFRARSEPPRGAPREGLAVTENLLLDGAVDLYSPDTMERYFHQLYQTACDTKKIQSARAQLAFATVAKLFKLIDEQGMAGVVVPWGEGAELIQALDALGDERKPSRELYRKLQRFTVSIPERSALELLGAGHVRMTPAGVLIVAMDMAPGDLYGELSGLDNASVPDPDPLKLMPR
ncbi:MAG: CRISPR-associated endonuclease Cas3'' [Acidobacteriota bacterium]